MTKYCRRIISYPKEISPEPAYNSIKSLCQEVYLHNVGKRKIGARVSSRQLRKIRALEWITKTKADEINSSLYWPED